MNNSASIIVLTLMLALSGCGDKKSEVTTAKSTNAAQKEAGHHDGDHAKNTDGHDKHGAGKHEESEHSKDGHAEEGHEEGEEGKVALTPAQIKTAGIELATVGPAPIRETLPLYGVVAPNAERVRDVSARYAGTIRRVDKKIGDQVRQGETLATVESNESLQTYAIVAPLAGVVTARNANPGEQTSDKSLFTVADLSTVWIELSLFPRDVAKVRVGQSVRVKSTDAGLSANGTMAYVAPFGSSANQTLTARVILNNAEHRWAPGLYVNADVTLSEQSVALAIRNDAVQTIEGKSVVFVQHDDGFEPHAVRLGRSDGEFSEVLEGPEAGQTYATANSFVLKAELTKGEASHEH
jgi:cobalt-zinc-cadmium efflux system membrane fusion protein